MRLVYCETNLLWSVHSPLLTSILKLPITILLSYVLSAIQADLVHSSNKMIGLLQQGGLYTLKHIHFFLGIVNSEQVVSDFYVSKSFSILFMKAFFTSSINSLPFL